MEQETSTTPNYLQDQKENNIRKSNTKYLVISITILIVASIIFAFAITRFQKMNVAKTSSKDIVQNKVQGKITDKSFQILYVTHDRYQKPIGAFVSNIDGSEKHKIVNGNSDNLRYSLIGNGEYISRTNGSRLEIATTDNYMFKIIDTITQKNATISQASLTLDGKHFWYVVTRNLLPVPQGLGDPLERIIFLQPVEGGEKILVKTYQSESPESGLMGINVEKNESYWREYCFECEGKIYVENLKNGNKIRETNKNYTPFWKHPKTFNSDFSKVYYLTHNNELIEYNLLTNTLRILYTFHGLDPESSPFVDLFLSTDNSKLYLLKSQEDKTSASLYLITVPDGKLSLIQENLPIRFSNDVTFSPNGEYLWYTDDFRERIFDMRTKKDYVFYTETPREESSNINPNEMITVVDNGISFLGWIPR